MAFVYEVDSKRQLMELINNMPPHEGKSFEEALAEHLLINNVIVKPDCGKCYNRRLDSRQACYQCLVNLLGGTGSAGSKPGRKGEKNEG